MSTLFKHDLTIITTYYNEPDLIVKFIDRFKTFKQKFNNIYLIVVDDGSCIDPAISSYDWTSVDGVSLYKVTKDLGFNSHGARNLAMSQSKTYWNLLIDIDQVLDYNTFDVLSQLPFNQKDVYVLTTNTMILNRDTFFSCKGYDEEFVNIHYGDRLFLNYLEKNYNYIKLPTIKPEFLREGREVIYMNIKKTTYEDDVLYQPIVEKSIIRNKKYMVQNRYVKKDFSSKQIINFDWIQVL